MKRRLERSLKATVLASLALVGSSCTSTRETVASQPSGGVVGGVVAGGVLGASSVDRGLIEVRGYALSPTHRVPTDAIGYAVPVFTDLRQAARFCPAFRSQLTFAGSLERRTPLVVQSYGQRVQIAPFVWPVTSWTNGDKPTCEVLVARYNLAGARMFFDLAQRAIVEAGGRPVDALEPGPFLVTARRTSGAVIVYDLSRAPDNDYGRWLARSVRQLSNPTIANTIVVRPSRRDQVRAFVFGALPAFEGVLNLLIPGYKEERRKG